METHYRVEHGSGTEITREITETPEIQTRTGVTTSVVEDFVEQEMTE